VKNLSERKKLNKK